MDHLKDKLAAMVPTYSTAGGNATLIYTTDGTVIEDSRTVRWNLRRLARLYAVDLEASRRKQATLLHYTQGLPVPLSASLVLIPLKTRKPVGKNDGCHGYFSYAVIEGVTAAAAGERAKSVVMLSGKHSVPCLFLPSTVRRRIRDGALALERYLAEMSLSGPGDAALCEKAPSGYWRLLEQLVNALVERSSPGESG